MKDDIRDFMLNELDKAISDDYVGYIVDDILDDVVDNVQECADKEYSVDDIRMAIGRVLMTRLDIIIY